MSATRPRIVPEKAPILPQQTTAEHRFWRSFSSTQLVKEHNAVTHIAFNPQPFAHDFAVTSSTRVQIFSSKTRQVIKTFNRFKDVVYSANFRQDGKLLCCGDATGLVSVFDSYNPRNLLLSIQPSTHPTHVTKFHPVDNKLLSVASDDRIVRLYDISHAYEPITSLAGADDYVRSICFMPNSPNLCCTGSYDGQVRIYDIRNNEIVLHLKNGPPVEDIISISSTQLVSCGGPSFKVWDIQSGGQILYERGNFAKTVTCLDYVENHGTLSSMTNALLVSSLDGHVKIFDPLDRYHVKFGWKFSAPVLSCALSPSSLTVEDENNKHIAVGLSSGLLAIRTKRRGKKQTKGTAATSTYDVLSVNKKSNNFQRMMRGSEYKGDQEYIIHNDKLKSGSNNNNSKKLRAFERNINNFKWSEALDSAFIPGMAKELTLTVLQELRTRGKIRVALYDRDESSLEPLLNWCLKSGIEDVRSAPVVADWIAVVLEIYGDSVGQSPVLEELLIALREKVRKEIHRAKEAQKIEGMLQLITNN